MSAHSESRRRRRALSAEERALWRGFVRAIKPLRGRAAAPAEPPDADDAPRETVPVRPPPKAKPKGKPVAPAREPVRSAPPPPLAALARRERQKLARGSMPIDARLDLHGMTQSEAHGALSRFLHRAQHDGAKFVLVVTGKGTRSGDSERGVLRRQVPHWLRSPELRDVVLGFEEAHLTHGGEGALYVRLKRFR